MVKLGTITCEVATVSSTVVTCVTPKSPTTDANSNPIDAQLDVAVIIKITEESTCGIGAGCNFDWKATATPTITSSSWSGSQLTLTGTNLGTDVNDVTVKLADLTQDPNTLLSNSLTVTLINLATKSESLKLEVSVAGKGLATIATASQSQATTGFVTTYSSLALVGTNAAATGSSAG